MAKVLVDPDTGERYQIDDAGAYSDTGNGADVEEALGGAGETGIRRPLPPQDRQLRVFLESTERPDDLRRKFWGFGHKLALIKLTRPEEYRVVRMQLENIIRAAYITSDIPDAETLLNMELLEFESGDIELRRSNTYDGKPNERELWTIQGIHQRIERPPEEPQGSGFIANLYRRLKGGR